MTARAITLEPYMRERTRAGAFRGLLWKEFRELIRPGLTALAIVGVGLLFSTSIGESSISAGMYAEASGGMPSLFTLTSAVAALLVGWSQIRRENRGDAWALLVHRPAPRATIFWSKAIAGGITYLLAAGIPMLLAAAWEATPGNRPAPFDVRLMLPNVADLLCGLVYYAAALLSTMREARWYASRALPIGAALVCSVLVIVTPSFGIAVLVCAAGVVVVGAAARSTFVAGGFYEPQPVAPRALLGMSVSLGLIIVGWLALTLISAFLLVGRTSLPRMARVAVASDGTLVRIVTTFLPLAHSSQAATDLTGRPVDLDMVGVVSTPAMPLHPDPRHGGYRSTANVFVPVASILGRPSATSWYYVRRERAIAIYDNVTSLRIGWIVPDGYSPGDAPPANRFEGDLRPPAPYGFTRSLIALPTAVYRLDRDRRAIQRIFTAAAGEEILGAGRTGESSPTEQVDSTRRFDAIVTSRRVHIQALDGTAELDFPPDPSAAGFGTLKVVRATVAAGTPTFAWYSAHNGTLPEAASDTAKDRITRYDSAGVAVAHVAVRAFSSLGQPERTQWAEIVVRQFLEPIAVPIGVWMRRTPTSGEPLAPGERQLPVVVGWIASLVGAIVFAIVAWIVARRYAFSAARQRWWTFVGFAGGALGVLLMLSLIEWPARVACPACGKARVVTRERCEHCGAPFSAPARDGTEIFEAAV